MASLADVLRALTSGRLSSRAYTDNLLARIQARDAQVRAWARIDAARARACAEACDVIRKNTGSAASALGPLHGLPIGVKDIIDTADLPTERGSSVFAEDRPAADAAIVARLKDLGGFVLGKTATTEFAYMQPAETRNPWNPAHTPGGSSAGSAAAIAAGFVHAAIGTQTNGSVIRPAAYCGVVGFKPTFGLLPFDGALYFSPTFDTIGTFARDVADCARVTAHLVANGSLPHAVAPLRAPPALGVIIEYPWNELEPDARTQFDQALQRLVRAGAQLAPVALPPVFDNAPIVHRTIMLHEGARIHRDLQDTHRKRMSALLNAGLDEGRRISAATYGEMLARRAALIEQSRRLFAEVDAIVSPPASGTAPKRLDITGDPSFCTLWSLLGVPAIAVPSGIAANGLPFGLQLACDSGQDAKLLRVAHWIEATLGPVALKE